ncbi:MAG: glycosyltransferase family 2 protein, partial [Polyangiaceae bacterium]
MPRACAVIPALDAAETVGGVIRDIVSTLQIPALVVDDGSTDATGDEARRSGALVLRHERNLGKGAAIRTGLGCAHRQGFDVALTVDADGQHPVEAARAVLFASGDPRALVLGVRDLARDGAPRSNRFGNATSNFFLSHLSGSTLRDTQCGLRRYPVAETLDLGVRATGYAFEGEVLLRAISAGLPLVEIGIPVRYPSAAAHRTHFRLVLDPTRIVAR